MISHLIHSYSFLAQTSFSQESLFVGLVFVSCFLIGGIPFGYLIGKAHGVDIRTLGSGNIGATNVYRNVGKKWGCAVFFLDFVKAFAPVVLLKFILGREMFALTILPHDIFFILAGAVIVCGHNYSPYMGFKGGKGMASSAGFIFALFPWSGLVCVIAFLIVFYFSKMVSAGSIAAALALPVSTVLIYSGRYWLWGIAVFLGVMSIWRHRTNMERIWAGTENRFGAKKNEN